MAVVAACVVLAPTALNAQRAGTSGEQTSSPSAEARAAELRATVALVTTPDRELNIANMEGIVESGDVRRIELAIRALVASEDPVLRGMAMRAYLSTARDIVLEVVLSDTEMKLVQQARTNPGFRGYQPPYQYLDELARDQFKYRYYFEASSIRQSRGRVANHATSHDSGTRTEYVARGDRITFRLAIRRSTSIYCEIELRPTKEAEIVGTMACDRFSRPISLAASMF